MEVKVFDNVTEIVRDDMASTISKGSKVSIAAACFSMYAYKELKKQLESVDECRFIFTYPTFVTEKAEKQKREFYIPRLNRESSLYGTEFELKLRNEMTQKAIAKECAEWIKRKATFKSNTTGENMGGFVTVANKQQQVAYMPMNGFTTVDIGCERGNNSYNMVNRFEAPFSASYMQLFETLWNDHDKMQDVTDVVIENITTAYNENSPEFIYFMTLYHVFSEFLDDISEDELPNEATGFKQSKIWSLLYVDEVAKYKQYDAAGQPMNGSYAEMFEEEYNDVISNLQIGMGEDDYMKYLSAISADKTHAGYFSIDKKGKMIDSKVARKETTTDDVDAYDLIMKNKELLLDRNPKKSPVRFIFSHSALREGWDNPNVFQICTLKQSSSDVRKRQEVGRGLRLCVNQDGERMDTNVLGNDVHNVNVLTVIASESYDSFAKGLQKEIAEAVADRPKAVTAELFIGKVIKDDKGNEQVVDGDTGRAIHFDLIVNGYIDKKGVLTDKYYEDKANGELKIAEEVADSAASVIEIIDSIYDSRAMQPENARSNNVELEVDESKLAMPEFKALWAKINSKSVYVVDFDTDELVRKSIDSLDRKLRISKIYFKVETGAMEQIKSKEELVSGASFVKEKSASYGNVIAVSSNVKYDLIGKLVDETGLTRKAIVQILQRIKPETFEQFKINPEEFIIKAATIINDEKATAIIEHITYDVMDDKYGTDVFTDPTIKGRLGVNAMKAKKHLYDHIVYDSSNEQAFATELDTNTNVAVYVKLPDGFYISTPVGHYNPDWAIAFYEGTVKHIYFVAETKGSMNSMQLRLIEESKIHCAREHFKAISNGEVVYDVVDSYKTLLDMVTK